MNISTYLIMGSVNDNFYKDFSLIYHISFPFFCLASFIFLLKAKRSPGFLEKNSNENLPIDTTIINTSENNSFNDTKIRIVI